MIVILEQFQHMNQAWHCFGFVKKFFHSFLDCKKLKFNGGTFMNEKLIKISLIDKIHSKTDCIDGKILNGIRQPILFSSGFDSLHGQAKNKKIKQTS